MTTRFTITMAHWQNESATHEVTIEAETSRQAVEQANAEWDGTYRAIDVKAPKYFEARWQEWLRRISE